MSTWRQPSLDYFCVFSSDPFRIMMITMTADLTFLISGLIHSPSTEKVGPARVFLFIRREKRSRVASRR